MQSRKFLIPYSLVVMFLLGSCSIFQTDHDPKQIEGRWEWMRSTGGIGGWTITPDSAGYSKRVFHFNGGSQFSEYRADTLFRRGHYSFRFGKERFELQLRVYRDDYQIDKWGRFPSEDSLVLNDQCYDCYTSYYRRIE